MNLARWLLSTTVTLLAVACASSDRLPPYAPAEAYDLQISENAQLKRFDIRLVSRVRYSICMAYDQWPNGLGQVDAPAPLTILRSGNLAFTAKEANFGYPSGPGSELRLRPGKSFEGFIGFDQFGDAARIAALPDKKLEFPVEPYRCEPGIN